MRMCIRELGPREFDLLDAVFAGLSPGSRLNRYHAGIPHLLSSTHNVLAAADGCRHIAVSAHVGDEPVGIARLIAAEGSAEIVVEVVDHWQGCGIGTQLARAVVQNARERGHAVIEADILAENPAVRRLIERIFPEPTSTLDEAA